MKTPELGAKVTPQKGSIFDKVPTPEKGVRISISDLCQFAEEAVVVQYADDDTQLLVSGPKSHFQNTIARLERVLASLDIWFRFNGLKVNADKTHLMLLGSQQNVRSIPPFSVKFRDHHLVPRSEAKKSRPGL